MAEITQFDFLWDKIKERVKQLVNPISYDTFIANLVPVDVVNKKIVLRADTEVSAMTVTQKHVTQLREAIVSSEVGLNDFVIIVEGSDVYTLEELPDAVEESSVVLDKRYTFDSFVEIGRASCRERV